MTSLVVSVVALLAISELAILLVLSVGDNRRDDARPWPSPSERPPRDRYYLRLFYVNPDDPRGIVPKRSGIGWTVNFRTKAMARLFAILLATTIALGAALACGVCGV